MHPILEEINAAVLAIQDYLNPSLEKILELTPEQREEFEQKRKEVSNYFDNSIWPRFKTLIPELSPEEIMEGYLHGCKSLKESLGGLMFTQANKQFVPTMIWAIQTDEESAYGFLLVLQKHLDINTFSSIVRMALNSKHSRTCRNALGLAYELRLLDAMPRIRQIAHDTNPQIAEIAQKILQQLDEDQCDP